jgi:hypothetical protein
MILKIKNMNDLENKREQLITVLDKIDDLNQERKILEKELQAECPHEYVISTPFNSTFEERRLCLFCGYEADVDYRDYKWKSIKPIKTINNRDEFYTYRRLKHLKMRLIPDIF